MANLGSLALLHCSKLVAVLQVHIGYRQKIYESKYHVSTYFNPLANDWSIGIFIPFLVFGAGHLRGPPLLSVFDITPKNNIIDEGGGGGVAGNNWYNAIVVLEDILQTKWNALCLDHSNTTKIYSTPCCIKQDWARTCEGRLQSQLSVLGYLYGFLTPVKGLHDFASISGLAFLGVAFLPVHSPRMLWVIGAAWFYSCLPLASHCLHVTSTLWMLWAAWFHAFLPHFYHFSPPVSQCAVGALSRMNLHFSPIYAQGGLGHLNLNLFPLSPTCPPLVPHRL